MSSSTCEARDKTRCPHHPLLAGLPAPGSVRRGGLSIEALAEFKQLAGAARLQRSEAEERRLEAYTHLDFMAVNRYLTQPETWGGNVERMQRNLALLDAAIARAPRADTPRTLYRAIRKRHIDPVNPDIKTPLSAAEMAAHVTETYRVGETLSTPAYSSTSLDSDYMLMFTKRRPNDYIIFEILTDQGLPYEAADAGHGSNVQDHEREVLLPRGSRFEIVNAGQGTYELSDTEKYESAMHFGYVKARHRYHVVQLRQIP
jgi:hypothetical protein